VIAKLPQNVPYYGADRKRGSYIPIQAGPLNLIFREGVFRSIKLERREVIRAVYFAVRDENWHTIPGVVSNLDIRSTSDSFKITYDCAHQERGIDFRWTADVSGEADGSIVWKMEGRAFTSFLKNRIGICVLHPIDESIGEPCQITHTDGTLERSRFPAAIAPHQPFLDVAAMCFRVNSELDAELAFAGDVFETEDQRNWTDASFKTYSTPLSLPYPASIEEGTTVSQTVTLRLRGTLPAFTAHSLSDGEVTVTLRPETRTQLPRIGFKWAGSRHLLSETGVLRLKALSPSHLSVDLHIGDATSEEEFWKATEEAMRLSLPLEVALALDADSAQLRRVLNEIVNRKVDICSWLADVRLQLPTRHAELRELEAFAPVAFGAGANFAELNRNRPSAPPAAGVWFSLNPQVHATDDTTLIENLAAQSSALTSIRSWFGSVPITVSPVSLKPRIALPLRDEELSVQHGLLPEDVDGRQSSLLGAGWTLGSLKHLAEGGAATVTFYETAGWKGVMEAQAGSPLPSHFLSIPDAVFPMYHIFANAADFKGAEVIRTESSDPLRVEAITLIQSSGLRVMVANLSAGKVSVNIRLSGIAKQAELRKMDEDNVEFSMVHPEAYRQQSAQLLEASDGCLKFDLRPFAIATIDAPQGTGHSTTGSFSPGGRP